MELLVDLVRSLPGIGTPQRAVDAIKMGVGLKTHYMLTCHERFHADGNRCILPEFLDDPYWGRLTGCSRWHHISPKWTMDFTNLVVTEGRNALLNRTFDAPGADVLWYVGLVGPGTGTIALTTGTGAVTGTGTTFDAALAVAPVADIIIVGAGAAAVDYIGTITARSSTTAITVSPNAGTTVTVAPFATEAVPTDTLAAHINSWTDTAPYSNATRPAWTKNGTAAAGAMSNSAAKASFTINAPGRAFGAFLVSNNTKSGTTGTLYGLGLDITNGSRSVLSGDTINSQVDLSVTAS